MPESNPSQGAPNPSGESSEPIDRMIASLREWLDEAEAKLEQATEEARIPDDIPRFVTRYTP